MENVVFGVPGIDDDAGEAIRKRLERVPGVHGVTVWVETQQVDVHYDPELVDPRALAGEILQVGFVADRTPLRQRWPG
ncbi:MAG: heavy-metal-associated domain-containing protein [Anaerolineae bacterium]|nr:heavy-metal-associated domain-containing protein [Anaerolineae bacterium]